MDNQGIAALARVLQGRTKEQNKSQGFTIELATIPADYMLKPDTMPGVDITPADYFSLNNVGFFRDVIKKQRRVVLAWFGNEPIVLGEYKTGTEMINGG